MANSTNRAITNIFFLLGFCTLAAISYFSTQYYLKQRARSERNVISRSLDSEIKKLENEVIAMEVGFSSKKFNALQKNQVLRLANQKIESIEQNIAASLKQDLISGRVAKDLERRLNSSKEVVSEQYAFQLAGLNHQVNEREPVGQESNSQEPTPVPPPTPQEEVQPELAARAVARGGENEEISPFAFPESETEDKPAEKASEASLSPPDNTVAGSVPAQGEESELPHTITLEQDGIRLSKTGDKSLEVCMRFSKNVQEEKGTIDIYMVFRNPDGTISANYDDGISGRFKVGKRKKVYTAKRTLQLPLSSREACITYQLAERQRFSPGRQTVAIFTSNQELAKSVFTWK